LWNRRRRLSRPREARRGCASDGGQDVLLQQREEGLHGSVVADLCRTYSDLVELIVERLNDDMTRAEWAGPVTGIGTINAFIRRLRSSLKALGPIIRGDLVDTGRREVSTSNQRVTVVDLHNLPERAQRFVVGVVLAAETARKEEAGPGSLLFTMIDELNKYAPRGREPRSASAICCL
jgi:hypothetical protein